MVVLHEEQHRHVVDRGQIERFVKLARAAAAVADNGQPKNLLAMSPAGPGSAHHRTEHLAQVAYHGQSAVLGVAVMYVALQAVRGAIGVCQVLADHVVRRRAQ